MEIIRSGMHATPNFKARHPGIIVILSYVRDSEMCLKVALKCVGVSVRIG